MTEEKLQVLITANTAELKSAINDVQNKLGNMQKKTADVGNKMTKTFSFIKKSVIGLALGKILGSQIDSAVDRLDALNNFPKVMANLGIGSEDAQASINRMSDALLGLPTTLDAGALAVQRFTSANGNVKASTEMFLALNNAILAGGASTQIQSTALEQLSQAYAKGKPDMMEWRSAMTAMPAQLKQVATAMGYVTSDQLGEALREGEISMNDFMLKIVELNKKGLEGFENFDTQARNATGGVRTSLTNLKTTIARSMADIMNAIGQSNIAGFFDMIKNAIIKATSYIAGFVKACVWAVSIVSQLFGGKKKKEVQAMSDATGGLKDSLGSIGTGGASASKGMDKATGSAKKLKKELNGLASFDEMNVLKENDNSDSGSSSGDKSGAGNFDMSGMDLSMFDDLNSSMSETDKIAEKIKGIFGQIGEILKKVWDSEPVQAYVGLVEAKFNFMKDLAITLGTDLWNNMTTTWNNIKDNVGITFTNISTLFTNMWTDTANGINEWGPKVIEGVSGLFNSIWQDAIDPYIQIIAQAWADFSGILVKTWDKHGKPLIDNIGEFVTKTIEYFQKIWDGVLEPIITPFLETLSWLWDKHLKGLIEELGDFIGKLVNGALEIYNKFIQPIMMWLVDYFAPTWRFLSTLVIGVVGTIIGHLSDMVKSAMKILGGIIDFITGVFTGNWKKAWEGVRNIFKGVIDGLAGIFKTPINLIIDGINSFLAGINKIKIPDWVPGVGGKSFKLQKIPKLARGGIVDKPTTALVGENGKEAILPIENNTGWIEELANKINANGGGNQPARIIFQIGDDVVVDKFIENLKEKEFETNGGVFAL